MAHLWSGRFAGDPDAALFEFGASFKFDQRLFEDDVTGSIAWAEALHKAGVLSLAAATAPGTVRSPAVTTYRTCRTDAGILACVASLPSDTLGRAG